MGSRVLHARRHALVVVQQRVKFIAALGCSGGEDGTVRVWDLRAPGCQRAYESRAAVNTVVLHPNQGELISGASTLPGHMGRVEWLCASDSLAMPENCSIPACMRLSMRMGLLPGTNTG
eukprot:351774-Chlamydomonas_euryale.AAC.3